MNIKMGRQTKSLKFWSLKKLGEPVGDKGEGRKGEKKGRKLWSKVGNVIFSPSSSFPIALQVVARERSHRKPRTSKFLMVGKLGFDVFHV